MSIGGAIASVGKAINTGVNVGIGLGFKNAGGFGTMATMGAIGAAAGAGSTLASDGTIDPLTGAAVGGVVGAAALPVAGMAAGAMGSAAVGAIKMAPAAGSLALRGAAAASPFVLGVGGIAAAEVGTTMWNLGKKMIDWDHEADTFDKIKFTNPITGLKAGWRDNKGIKKITGAASGAIVNGWTVLGGTAAVEGIKKSWSTIQTAKMGQMTGVETLTPRMPSYSNNAGASGDLVFALNANRRG